MIAFANQKHLQSWLLRAPSPAKTIDKQSAFLCEAAFLGFLHLVVDNGEVRINQVNKGLWVESATSEFIESEAYTQNRIKACAGFCGS